MAGRRFAARTKVPPLGHALSANPAAELVRRLIMTTDLKSSQCFVVLIQFGLAGWKLASWPKLFQEKVTSLVSGLLESLYGLHRIASSIVISDLHLCRLARRNRRTRRTVPYRMGVAKSHFLITLNVGLEGLGLTPHAVTEYRLYIPGQLRILIRRNQLDGRPLQTLFLNQA